MLPHYRERTDSVARLCGPGNERILELGACAVGTAAALADRGHNVTALHNAPSRVAYAQELARRETRPGKMTVPDEALAFGDASLLGGAAALRASGSD